MNHRQAVKLIYFQNLRQFFNIKLLVIEFRAANHNVMVFEEPVVEVSHRKWYTIGHQK